MTFTGQASWFDPWDINLYVAAIKSGQTNGILLNNAYTTLPNPQIIFYPLYTLSGLLFSNLNPFFIFHLLAAVFGLLLIITIWKITAVFLHSPLERLIAIFLTTTGGGIGWLFFPRLKSADLFITSFTYVSSFQRAHEALGVILYLVSLVAFFVAVKNKKILFNIISTISLTGLVIIYPYYTLSYFLIGGIYSLYIFNKEKDKTAFTYLFVTLLIILPMGLWYNSILRSNPTMSGVLSQKLPTPNILGVLAGWGILVPFLILQLINPKKDTRWVFLNIWIWTSLLISYMPFGFSRFYLRGLYFPLVILIIISLPHISTIVKFPKKIILIILIFLLPISTFYITYKRVEESANSNPWYYLTSDQELSLEFLRTLPQKSNILTLYRVGNMIPANSKNNVYVGHLIQTPEANKKLNIAQLFYTNRLSKDETQKFLSEQGIYYIYYGLEEKQLTENYDKTSSLNYSQLQPVFQKGEIIIYRYQLH